MYLQTIEYRFSRYQFVKLYFQTQIQERWSMILYILLFVFCVAMAIEYGYKTITYIIIGIPFFITMGYQWWIWRNCRRLGYVPFKRQYEIDEYGITIFYEDIFDVTIAKSEITDIKLILDFYVVFYNNGKFIEIPYAIFRTPDDKNIFLKHYKLTYY